MGTKLSFEGIVSALGSVFDGQQDQRKQSQCKYRLSDAGLGAFSVFYTQSPSFLAHQRDMERRKGMSNSQKLFDMVKIPTDTHIRTMLDKLEPACLGYVYRDIVQKLKTVGALADYEVMSGYYLLALDGTDYFSSEKIHCDNCSSRVLKNGKLRYSHSVIPPVLVAPTQNDVISLEPEFIKPQDGEKKQDCEIKAAKRWLKDKAAHYPLDRVIVLGDDLYCHQPFAKDILSKDDWHFVLVCKPDSHKTLYDYLALQTPESFSKTVWNGRFHEVWTYHYANALPLRDSDDTLWVNWCELSIHRQDTGELLYKNSFATDIELSKDIVPDIIRYGRSRWKTENENNNVLKTKGYYMEHNYGHGQAHLASVLLSLLLLAFLTHTVLALTDAKYQAIRAELGARKTFFDDVRALLRYKLFDSWAQLLDFMIQGLDIRLDSS
jgi:hypothetical protein